MKILNALSLNMYDPNKVIPMTTSLNLSQAKGKVWLVINDEDYGQHKADPSEVRWVGESCIGHADLARILSSQLSLDSKDKAVIPQNRVTVNFKVSDQCLIAQYKGERLPEGCTELPSGSSIEYVHVNFISKAKIEKAFEIANECDRLSHDEAGWSSGLSQVQKNIFEKFFPEHWDEHAFD